MKEQINLKIGLAALIGILLALNAVRTVTSGAQQITLKLGFSAFTAGAAVILASTFLTEKTGAKGLAVLWLLPLIPVSLHFQINTGLPNRHLLWGTMYVALLGAATTDYFIKPEPEGQ